MKNYSRIAARLFSEPTLLTPAQHAAFCLRLETKLLSEQAGSPQIISGQPAPMAAQPMKRKDRRSGMYWEEDDNKGVLFDDELRIVADTAIIAVHGTLVAHPEDIAMSECGCAMEGVNAAIAAAENNPAINHVIYDFRTPGGSVTMIPETGRRIRHSQKDTIAFTDSECCSGGLWLAAQCRQFYGTGSSRIGSVGVYTMCLDMSEALRKEGVKVNTISAGKYKLLGAYWKEMTDDERAILQTQVNKIYAQFRDAMETWRVVSDEHFGSGLVFDGEEAAQLGFTDGVVESMDDILEEMV